MQNRQTTVGTSRWDWHTYAVEWERGRDAMAHRWQCRLDAGLGHDAWLNDLHSIGPSTSPESGRRWTLAGKPRRVHSIPRRTTRSITSGSISGKARWACSRDGWELNGSQPSRGGVGVGRARGPNHLLDPGSPRCFSRVCLSNRDAVDLAPERSLPASRCEPRAFRGGPRQTCHEDMVHRLMANGSSSVLARSLTATAEVYPASATADLTVGARVAEGVGEAGDGVLAGRSSSCCF